MENRNYIVRVDENIIRASVNALIHRYLSFPDERGNERADYEGSNCQPDPQAGLHHSKTPRLLLLRHVHGISVDSIGMYTRVNMNLNWVILENIGLIRSMVHLSMSMSI